MNITPFADRIFVLPDKVVDKTDSGIILSDFSKKRPTSGTILAIGKDVNKLICKYCKGIIEIDKLKIGDRVWYGQFAGEPNKAIIKWQGEEIEIFIMTRNDINATLD